MVIFFHELTGMDEQIQREILNYIEHDNFIEALEKVSKYISSQKNDADAIALKAMILLEMDQPEEALKEANKAIKLNNFHFYNFLAGSALLELGLIDDAIRLLKKSSDESDDDPGYLMKLASAFEMNGDIQSALKAIIRAIKSDPDNAELVIIKASLLNALHREREAILELNKIRENEELKAEVYFVESESQMNLKHIPAAEKSILKALELTKDSPDERYLERASEIETILNKPDEALKFINEAISINNSNERYKLIKGSLLLDFKMHDEAKTFGIEQYKDNKNNPLLTFMLIDILSITQDLTLFTTFLNEAGFPESLNALIKIYYGLDEQEDESNIENSLSNLSTDVKGNQFQEDLSVILYNNLSEEDEEDIDDE